ncbi:helix-turn-helix domain-containing protein [Priestia aryabhattai]|uniref:helix-turn-helix domain-containing protein n=1 Tax=Priestia aryabhattai TaxID=412384 RepID=UPI00398206AC
MELGEQLQRLREQKNMSREELAQKMNVSRQAVYKWENNKGYPDIDNLVKLSELYKVSVDELLKDSSSIYQKTDDSQDILKQDGITLFDFEGNGNSFFRYGLMCTIGSLGGLSIPVIKGEINLSIVAPFIMALLVGFFLLKSRKIKWDKLQLKNLKWISRIIIAYLSVPLGFFSIRIIREDTVDMTSLSYLVFVICFALVLYNYVRNLYIKHV